jgi:hypothetical protein
MHVERKMSLLRRKDDADPFIRPDPRKSTLRRQVIIAVLCLSVAFLAPCPGSVGNGNGGGQSDGGDPPSLPADELTLTRALSGAQHFVVVDDALVGEAVEKLCPGST